MAAPTAKHKMPPGNTSIEANTTLKNVAYYTEWNVEFPPKMLPAADLSHVLYSFAQIDVDGTVHLPDLDACCRAQYGSDIGTPVIEDTLFDSIKELYLLKKYNRHMKTLISIGGWTYTHDSPNLAIAATTKEGRANFVASAVQLVKDFGFDGIDIDWEYPNNGDDAIDFVLLLKDLRAALDVYAERSAPRYHFLIAVACPSGASEYEKWFLKEMDQYLDSWHVMAYDYAGGWSNVAGHGSNLYYNDNNPAITAFSAHKAINGYIDAGIPAKKMIMGVPLYGRTFEHSQGLGMSHSGSMEITYKDLPKTGATEFYDPKLVATWSFDPSIGEVVTYVGKEETNAKAEYVKEHRLGGMMWWEASQDKRGNDSLIHIAAEKLGKLDNTQNWLSYPESKYRNIRNGMKEESVVAKVAHWLGVW
ncbi:hypothetical protein EG329_013806 [Mollisiaceae sp. DMI_Dod_QoI]|nr:hypothetical protein EG329_013806 [Helotiales sp. DMI_Dod_QoI]